MKNDTVNNVLKRPNFIIYFNINSQTGKPATTEVTTKRITTTPSTTTAPTTEQTTTIKVTTTPEATITEKIVLGEKALFVLCSFNKTFHCNRSMQNISAQ